MLEDFVDAVNSGMELVINFGQDQLFRIINEKIFGEDDDLVIRLLDPLPNDIEEDSTAWIVNELSDSFDDNNISSSLDSLEALTQKHLSHVISA